VTFSLAIDLTPEPGTVMRIMRAARCRWRTEYETFNSMRKRGDEFAHSFGLG